MGEKTFLVTGGSGFLGVNLCEYLINKGHKVVSVDLEKFDYPWLNDKIEHHIGDICDRKTMLKFTKNVDVIVHAAAALPLWEPAQIYHVNVDGTKNVMECAAKNNVKRAVFISSTSVYGIPKEHPLYETSPLHGVGPYGESKIQAEKICESFRNEMCVAIIRPKTFIGKERLGVFEVLFDWIRRGKNIPLVGKGKNRYQLLHVEDLCEAIYLCSTKSEKICNDTFNVGAEKFTTMGEDFGALVKHAGFGKRVVLLPSAPAILALRVLWALKLSPLYSWVFETADKDSFVSVDKIKDELGWNAKRSNKQALTETYDWYLQHYKEYAGKTGTTHRVPWNQKILKYVSYFF